MHTGLITVAELEAAIKKLQLGKAAGPDGLPVECCKDMDIVQLQLVHNLLSSWLEGAPTLDELTRAQVILLQKKGDRNNLDKYRPISLLNTNYKILTAIIQKRLADCLDKHIQETQYGFQRKRGTAQAIHSVRRIIEKGERTRTKTRFVLPDWETAFDKVYHDKIFESLQRMNVPNKIINMIRALYRKPEFRGDMEGV